MTPSSWPAAVLFDMDGLLVDSEPIWTVAEEQLAQSLGTVWSMDLKRKIVGTSLPSAIGVMFEHWGLVEGDRDAAQQFVLTRMAELFREALPMRPGALRLLDDLRDAGVPLALVSSSYRVLVDAALTELGAERFAVTVAGDEVSAHKPDPEPYLAACRALGVRPADAVVFEDSPAGIASGEAAGCLVVAVPDHVTIEPGPGRVVVRSLEDVDLAWMAGLRAA